MLRRDFFRRVVGGIAAAFAAPFLPKPSTLKPALAFHPNAFALSMAPIDDPYLLVDREAVTIVGWAKGAMTLQRGDVVTIAGCRHVITDAS